MHQEDFLKATITNNPFEGSIQRIDQLRKAAIQHKLREVWALMGPEALNNTLTAYIEDLQALVSHIAYGEKAREAKLQEARDSKNSGV